MSERKRTLFIIVALAARNLRLAQHQNKEQCIACVTGDVIKKCETLHGVI